MQSFRTELEDLNNPVVARDIIDLEKKIRLFREGKIDDEKFRSLRLARGIYGQRQSGVALLRFADLQTDQELVADASQAAVAMLSEFPEYADLHLQRWMGGREDYLKA